MNPSHHPASDAELPAIKPTVQTGEYNPPLTALWLFLVSFLVIESILHILPEGSMTRTLRHRSEEILYLPPTRIQFMGDSATNALQVQLIEKFLGGNHELSNYALPGTTPLFSYFVLKRQIAAGRAPNVIVFAPHPFTWGDSFMDRFLGRFSTPEESAKLLKDGVQLSDWVYGSLCRMSYTLRYREELYKLVTQGDSGFIESWKQQIVPVQNTRAKIEIDAKPPEEPKKSGLNPNNIPPILSRPISIHPYNEIYLDKFCDLAAKHDIQIIWLTLPIPEALGALATKIPEKERTAVYDDFVKRMAARHPNLHPIEPKIHTLPDTHYRDDYWHLNPYGSWVFSQRTGEQLAAWLKEHPLN
jgi:hypothetical protein